MKGTEDNQEPRNEQGLQTASPRELLISTKLLFGNRLLAHIFLFCLRIPSLTFYLGSIFMLKFPGYVERLVHRWKTPVKTRQYYNAPKLECLKILSAHASWVQLMIPLSTFS